MGIVNRSPVDVLTFQTKAMSGVQGLVQWTDTGTDGTATPSVNVLTLGGTYAQGPLAAGLQYKMHYFTDAYKNTTQAFGGIGRKNRLEAFATYDLGMAKVGVGFDGGNVGTVDNDLGPLWHQLRWVAAAKLWLISTSLLPIPWACRHLLAR